MDPQDPKLLQALLDNQKGDWEPPETVPESLRALFRINWVPAPEGFACPLCKGKLERTCGHMLSSPWSGSVRCTACTYRDSVCSYLARSMFSVEPMPPGAALIYERDPEVAEILTEEEPK